jgi:hypothetical protein
MALLDDINTFLERHELTERRFGELALNDKNLVADIRAGRSPSLNTADRIREFMMAYPNHEPFVPRRKAAA